MSLIQITTYKTIPYEDRDEEYSNVYVYETDPYPDLESRRAMMTRLLEEELEIHGNTVVDFRAESRPMEGTPVAVPQASDGEVVLEDSAGSFAAEADYFPQWVLMIQQRTAKKAWIRKYYHHYLGQGIIGGTDNNRWLWSQDVVDIFQTFVDAINPLVWNSSGGTVADSEAFLSTARRNISDPSMNVDNRMRIHELKY